jgi:Xaa-Pro aminopeptidase
MTPGPERRADCGEPNQAMLSDLDQLMQQRAIDSLIVPLHEAMHPSFRWLSGGAKITRGYVIKVRDAEPLLLYYPMERDEAGKSGLAVRSVHDFGFERIFGGAADVAAGYGQFFHEVLTSIGVVVGATIAFNGDLPIQLYVDVVSEMEQRGWLVHRDRGENLVQMARKRKSSWEIEAIASVGARTESVVERVRSILRTSRVVADRVVHDGKPLRLGDLKMLVSSEICRLGLVEDHETILSQGADAGVPHSRGDSEAFVRPSVPIVLDIFPADRNSGYFFDLTRTFCVGPVPESLAAIHADVLEAFNRAAGAMRAGTPASDYQALVCDFFEARGYSTTRANPGTSSGYVHSLGHGVGLQVHEKPFFHLSGLNHDRIEVGDVLTIEPGLYFPDREIGVRIEDTLWIDESGMLRTFCQSDKSLAP